MLRVLVLLVIWTSTSRVGGYGHGHFNGGSVSFSVHNDTTTGKLFVDLDVITGWVLAKGPCGPNCTKSDITMPTRERRHETENRTGDPLYFGNWTAEYKVKVNHAPKALKTKDLNTIIRSQMTGAVLAMNAEAEWEQERMKVSVELESENVDDSEDIYFEGDTWHHLTMQPADIRWHIQAKIDRRVRNDTGIQNRSPTVLVKPFYRIKLNTNTTIHIAAIDPDGDRVKCALSQFVESGQISNHPLDGVNVTENCTVTIHADADMYNYTDNAWGAIALTVRDYNKKPILLDAKKFDPYKFSLSGTAVQFLVQILETLNAPEFVPPTAPSSHHFILYAGTEWRQSIYARASENTTIEEFTVMGRQEEKLIVSDMHDGDELHVKFIEIKWKPKDSEVGNHIICITAVDDTGVDADEDRCFTITIKPDRFNHSSSPASDRPYFINLPAFEQAIACKKDVTCILPIYVVSNITVTEIQITTTFFAITKAGPVTLSLDDGDNVYESDLLFRDSVGGIRKICMVAKDINGTESEETCIQSNMQLPDPCASNPCMNGGTCSQSEEDSAVYLCHCISDKFRGRDCEHRPLPCDPDPCRNNGTCVEILPAGFVCSCYGIDFVGEFCTIEKDKCISDPCEGHGICNHGICSCYDRFGWDNCTQDKCPGPPAETITCDAPGCTAATCNSNGICLPGPVCLCAMGYRGDPNCGTASGNAASSYGIGGTKFVPPSPARASEIICYKQELCQFSVFLATTARSSIPTVSVDRCSEEIRSSSVSAVSEVTYIQGLEKLYTADITVNGTTTTETLFICLKAEAEFLTDRLCLEISFTENPSTVYESQAKRQATLEHKFIAPTLNDGSKLICSEDKECSLLLYTNTVSSICNDVVTADVGVHVLATHKRTDDCVSEVSYTFSARGQKTICFSATSNSTTSQTRCFVVNVYGLGQDICEAKPCQNDGDCFHDGQTDIYCVCTDGYTGSHCEKGECDHHENKCDRTSFCYANNHRTQCICPIGQTGPYCRERSTEHVTSSEFTDTAVPTRVTCVLNRPCTIPLGVSSKEQATSSIEYGFVSPHIRTSGISTETSQAGSVRATIGITPLEVGEKLVCVQTHANGSNQDEICIKLDITSDFSSLYGFKDKPNFIAPSLPNNAEVKCQADTSCHVLYHVTPGNGHDRACTKVTFTKTPFEHSHIFTPCAGCVAGYGQKNCSIDVSVIPPSANLSQSMEVCVAVELPETHLRGEERCFNITIESDADFKAKSGCQTIQCNNGGFCDAHIKPPVCFCEPGFSGPNCGTPISGGGTTSTGTFISTFGVPIGVTCSLNTSCSVNFHMSGPQAPKPTMSLGYIDPALGLETKPTLNRSLDGSGYTGTVVVTPSEAGESKVCMQTSTQGNVDDELCMTIQVGDGLDKVVDKTKPYFLEPTPTEGTTILCKSGQACYIQLFFPEGATLGSTNACPSVEDTSPTEIEGVHIFVPRPVDHVCQSNVAYRAASTDAGEDKKMCMQILLPGKPGEERCFNIKIKTDVQAAVDAPCRGITCQNNGKCIANLETATQTADCICQRGFEGADCSTPSLTSTHLPGVDNPPTGTSTTPHHFDGNSAIPLQVTCILGEICDIPFPFTGTKPPTYGYVDPRLNAGTPTLLSGGKVVTTRIQSNTTGTQRLCLQTTVDGEQSSVNVDEVCIEVKISAGSNASVDPSQPHFEKGTVPDNSRVACDISANCHIPIYSEPDGDTCPEVRECPPGVSGVHVFETKLENGACVTDAVYKTGATTTNETLCISAGPNGEERHIGVEVKPFTKFGPCQETHCENGGKCLADFTDSSPNAVCVCPPGQEGSDCETAITTHAGLPGISPDATNDTTGTGHFDGKAAMPKEIVCIQGEECLIPVPYHGTNPPTLGSVDPELTYGKPQIIGDGNTVTKVSSNTTGTHTVCLQTTLGGKPESENIDEVCVQVRIAPGPPAVKPDEHVPHFTAETLTENSTVTCEINTSCRIPVYTDPSSPGVCAPVKECAPGTVGVHVFETKPVGGKCLANAVLRTGSADTTETLCLSAGPDGEEKHLTVEVKHSTEFGPCQKLHCQNNGTCLADVTSTVAEKTCICQDGYSGVSCETPVSPNSTLPGTTGGPTTTTETPYFKSTAAIPREIKCVKDEPCRIPIPYHGNLPPMVGFVDPKLNHKQPTLLPDGNALTEVTATETGTHRICLQTTLNGTEQSTNVDELCIEVSVSEGPSSPTDQTKPHFGNGTVPDNSTVACNLNTHCHIPFYSEPKNGTCPEMKQCPPGVKGTHVFNTKPINGTCVAEVVYKTGSSATTENLCMLTGPGGEKRNIEIEVKAFTDFGPCQAIHCKNGGKCLADFHSSSTTAVCACPPGQKGDECDTAITTDAGLPGITGAKTDTPGTGHFNGNAAIPKEIICVKGEECLIPVPYQGSNPPTLGYVDPELTHGKPRIIGDGNTVTKVSSNTTGTHKVCLQTTLGGRPESENMDEVCVQVQIVSGPVVKPDENLPHFTAETATENSTVLCNTDISCRIPVYTKPSATGQCAPVKECAPGTVGVHVFETKPVGGKCLANAVLRTGSTNTTETLCLSAGPNGEQKHLTVEVKQSTEFGPCQKLHCQNNGTCLADLTLHPAGKTCVCQHGYSGAKCETSVPPEQTLPGQSGNPSPKSETPYFKSTAAIPSEIQCIKDEPCRIPIPYHGKMPPMVGYVDPKLNHKQPTLLPDGNALTQVTATETGTHRICLQTTLNGTEQSTNVDEICIEVKVSEGPSTPTDPTKPHFGDGTVPENSTVACNLNTHCHLPFYSEPKNGTCLEANLCPPDVKGTHVFRAKQINGTCVADVVYKTGSAAKHESLCMSTGPNGEDRHIEIDVKQFSKFGPCQETHCENGGKCLADFTDSSSPTAVCVCPPGQEGSDCGTAITGHTGLPGISPNVTTDTPDTGHFNGKAAIPKAIVCVKGEECLIPVPYQGTNPPTLGYVDPELTHGKPQIICDGNTVTKVSSNTTGTHMVCLQTTLGGMPESENIDEVCVKVQITPGPAVKPDEHKPHFSGETATENSTVLCQTDTSCRIPVYTKPTGAGQCVPVKECAPGTAGVHVFETKPVGGKCLANAVLRTGSANTTETLCLSAGPDGEERHLTVEVKQSTEFGPCQKIHCQNNGTCLADLLPDPAEKACICQPGYTGETCETQPSQEHTLQGHSGGPGTTSKTPYFKSTAAIPSEIHCFKDEPCRIPIPYHGNMPPMVGYVDPKLNHKQPTLLPDGNALTEVTATETGTHIICLQTTVNGTEQSANVDEICIEVKVSAGPSIATDQAQPHFGDGTVPENSTVACNLNTHCHIPVYSEPNNGTCLETKLCPPEVKGTHVFNAKQINGTCVAEVVYKTGSAAKHERLCMSTGPDGENRHIEIDVKAASKFGPCQETHCENGGKCLADFTDSSSPKAVCVCPPGQEGTDCGTAITAHTGLPGKDVTKPDTPDTGHFDGKAAIPKEIICVKGQECLIPVPYHGTKPPTLGYVDPELTHGKPQIVDNGNTVTKVSSNATGTHTLCLQTTLDGESESENLDEVCIQVKIAPGPAVKPDENLPHFTGETATENSTVLCNTDISCRIPVYTKQSATGQCDPVKECPPGVTGVHVFATTKLDDDRCRADAVIRTGTANTTEQLCLSAGPDGEEKHLTVKVQQQTEFGPCQTLHCQNNGKCLADVLAVPPGKVCICQHGFSGTKCETPVAPETHLPGGTDVPTTTDKTPHFVSTAAIPHEIRCIKDEPCMIPIPYNGSTLPLLGFVDPKLNPSQPKFLPDGNALVEVTTSEIGTHRFCLQTTVNGSSDSTNVDELCLEVTVSPGTSTSTDPTKSHFEEGTTPDHSTLSCNINTHCHIPFYSSKPPLGQCPEMKQCPPGIKEAHVFDPKPVGDTCVTEVVYKTGSTATSKSLCISTGPDGEERHVEIEVKQFTGFGPCQKLHCQNGGTCVANTTAGMCICPSLTSGPQCQVVSPCRDAHCKNGGVCRTDNSDSSNVKAECICPNGYTGAECDAKSPIPVDPLPGVTNGPNTTDQTPFIDGNTALPTEIVCIKGRPCAIPFHYTGPADKPPVLGTVSPGLNATGLTTLPVPGGSGPGPHTAVTMVTPTTDGTMKVCIQTTVDGEEDGENIDELCTNVKVTTDTVTTPDTTLPHFDNNSTLTDGSKVTCNVNIKCHIPVVTEKSTGGDCPAVQQCSTKIPDSFVLQTKPEDGKCITDIVVNTGNTPMTQNLCVSAGPGGEERHYKIETTPYTEFGPCQKVHCQHGGKCDSATGTGVCTCPLFVSGDTCQHVSPCQSMTCTNGRCVEKSSGGSTIPACACQQDYKGDNCNIPTGTPTSLAGVDRAPTLLPGAPRIDGHNAVPTVINCVANKHCNVPLQFYGHADKPPILGSVDPDLHAGTPAVVAGTTPAGGSDPQSHTLVTTITPSGPGTKQLCIQTTHNGTEEGINVDELCIEVNIQPAGTSVTAPDPTLPHFEATTSLPDGSTVTCDTDMSCHLPVVTEHISPGPCTAPEQCGSGPPGLTLFSTEEVNGTCVTDVVFRTGKTAKNDSICLSAGPSGETRHYTVETRHATEFGPCQKLHCEHGGKCLSQAGKAICKCPPLMSGKICDDPSPCVNKDCNNGDCVEQDAGHTVHAACACHKGYEGQDCDTNSTTPTGLPGVSYTGAPPTAGPGTPHLDGSSALPKEVVCYQNTKCTIPIAYYGLASKPPALGHVGVGVTASKPNITAGPSPGGHTALTDLMPTETGTHTVCIQTTADGAKNGSNIDEICVDVTVKDQYLAPPAPEQDKPLFYPSQAPDKSTFTCKPDSSCHMEILTNQNINGSCSPVAECGVPMYGVKVFATVNQTHGVKLPDGTVDATPMCVTDVVIRTGPLEVADPLCLAAGPDGESRTFKIETKHTAEFGPCQKKHCQNGGTCEAKPPNDAVCSCPPTYTGDLCEDVMSNTTTPDMTPCHSLTCTNGRCVEKSSAGSTIPACACLQGYEGDNCNMPKRIPTILAGVDRAPTLLPDAPRIDGSNAVPTVIHCVANEPCNVPLQFYGHANKPPILGSVDQDLHAGTPAVVPGATPAGGSDPQPHTLVTTITPSGTGTKQLCIQTTHNGTTEGINVDELCLEVIIDPAGSPVTPLDPTLPHFEATSSLPDGSKVICGPDTSCHLPVITAHPSIGPCPALEPCGSAQPGLTLFATESINGNCVTDVVFRTGTTAKNDSICLSAGPGGESRNYTVETKHATEFGPCQKLHCENGGKCLSQAGKARCNCPPLMSGKICDDRSPCVNKDCNNGHCVEQDAGGHKVQAACACHKGYEGQDCDTQSTSPTGLPGVSYTGAPPNVGTETPHLDGSTALPKEVVCYQNTKCTIPIAYFGLSSKPPILGHVGVGVNASRPTITAGPSPGVPGGHTALTDIMPTETGTHTVCIQTTADGAPDGANLDEICVDVTVRDQDLAPPAPEQDKPLFYPSQAPDKSTFTCKPDSSCHMEILTKLNRNGSCSPVKECGVPMYGVKVFDTVEQTHGVNLADGHLDTTTLCVTDVVIRTGTREVANPLCLAAGPDGEKRTFQVETKHTTEFGPCQKKHCQNGGKCDAKPPNDAMCCCPSPHTGESCEESSTNTTTPVGHMVCPEPTGLLVVNNDNQATGTCVTNIGNGDAISMTDCQVKMTIKMNILNERKCFFSDRKLSKGGHVTCRCKVNGKEVEIIKRNPAPASSAMLMSAGYGAAGMTGAMVLGVIVYVIVTKARRPTPPLEHVRPLPKSRPARRMD